MQTPHILIVEDELVTRNTLKSIFEAEGYDVFEATDGAEMHQILSEYDINLVIMDINLPGKNGLLLARELREQANVALMFLTGRDNEVDKILGLEIGADDYITKPFSLSVLRARVNTQLRKAESLQAHNSASVYRKGCYEFDFERMIFLVDGQEIELSKTEQRLLRLLVQNEGINLRRDFLLDRVWNDSAEFVDANALSVSVKRLRDKLGIPDSIKTVYGIGYRFE